MPTELTGNDVNTLAAKLDALSLTEAEQAILDGVLERAANAEHDEVSGFAMQVFVKTFKVEINGVTAKRLTGALGYTATDDLWE